jgi:hypothetical protein
MKKSLVLLSIFFLGSLICFIMNLWFLGIMLFFIGLILLIHHSGSKKKAKTMLVSESISQREKLGFAYDLQAFLSLFLNPRHLDTEYWQQIWSETLNRPYKSVIKDLVARGLLVEANSGQKLECSLRVSDLKQIMREYGLKVSGKKEELLSRLIESLPQEAEKRASSITDVYVCTKEGKEIAKTYKSSVESKRKNAEEEVRTLLQRKKIKNACLVIEEFIKSLPRPLAYGGAHPSDAEAILEIKSVSEIQEEDLEKIKVEAAFNALWGRRITGPKQFLSMAYKGMFIRTHKATLENYKASGVVKKVVIMVSPDSCPACKDKDGSVFLLEKELLSPTLPIENCTHEIGWCRCCYGPYLEN